MCRADRRLGSASKRKLALEVLLALAAIALLLSAAYAVGRRFDTSRAQQEVRGDLQGLMSKVTYNGISYEPKKLTTLLLMGIDKNAPSGADGFRSGGQADFLMLLLIDDEKKTVVSLQIDRDTMAEITVLGVLGNDAGTRMAQICLSHGFGDGKVQSCLLAQKAVSNLLGIEIDGYVAMNLDGISVLNDAVGGVTVTLEDDFTALDPAMQKGVALTLHGDQAEYYVRNRMNIGVGTNERRMERQGTFLKALQEKLSAEYHSDHDFLNKLYDALEPYLQTDIGRGRIINEAWKTRDFTYAGIVHPEGEYLVSQDGFMEFHSDRAKIQKLVIDLFYQPTD